MSAVAQPIVTVRRTVSGPALAAWLVGFAPVVYLLLRGGGYDVLIRGEAGVAIWWILLLGAAVGALPLARTRTPAAVALGLLLAFALWTAIGISWSSSSERSLLELARVLIYLGVFALAVAAMGRGRARAMLNGVGVAIALVGVLAVLSRLQPDLFPRDQVGSFLPEAAHRLGWPVNYWNALAAVMAIGAPVLLTMATSGKTVIGRAAAAATLPVLALAGYLTFSRGGLVAAVIGLLAVLALSRNRASMLLTLVVAGGGSALLIAGAIQRPALEKGIVNAAAHTQGDQFVVNVIAVAVGVGLFQLAVALLGRVVRKPGWASPSPRTTALIAAAAVGAVLLVAVAAGVPSRLSNSWDNFKQTSAGTVGAGRFALGSGNGRYQLWSAALDAANSKPVTGVGPGTYEFWWAQHGSLPSYVRNAHSLPLEVAAELGYTGLLLILGLLLWTLGAGALRAVRAPPDLRATLAAATAGCAAFVAASAFDWDWQEAGIGAAFFVLAAVALNGIDRKRVRRSKSGWKVGRIALIVGAVVALPVIGVTLATAAEVRQSRADLGQQHLASGLGHARTAESVQSGSASAALQRAQVLEQARDFPAAAAAAKIATQKSPDDWRNWIVLSRIEAERGRSGASLAAYRQGKRLNPRSPLINDPPGS